MSPETREELLDSAAKMTRGQIYSPLPDTITQQWYRLHFELAEEWANNLFAK